MRATLPLRRGDTVAVVAPSGPFPADRYEKGVAVLRERGFVVRELLPPPHHSPEVRRYLAAPDEARAAALREAFADPAIRAIFAARGGYGAMRLLPRVDWAAAAASGKPLVGFSDVTALHLALRCHGASSVHGPVVTRLGEEPPEALERLFSLLAGETPAPIAGSTVVAGAARGPLVGGCLSVLSRLVGTKWMPSLQGAVLLLEDVGERPYRLDRMWTHLQLAGHLDEIAGVVVGDLTACDEPGGAYGAWDVMEELLRDLGKPAIARLPIGHGDVNFAVPHGAEVELRDGALHFLEGLR